MTRITDFPDGYKEDYSEPCSRCGSGQYIKRVGPHIGLFCKQCGFQRWVKQKTDLKMIGMPYGKYKGKTVAEIVRADIKYAEWASQNIEGKVGDAFRFAIKEMEM